MERSGEWPDSPILPWEDDTEPVEVEPPNPNAVCPLSLQYRPMRRCYLRLHTHLQHNAGEMDSPVIVHIPAEMDGVVP